MRTIKGLQSYQAYNAYATYENKFSNAHGVKFTGGFNYETKYYEDLTASRDGLLSDELDDFNLAKGDVMEIKGGKNRYALLGLFIELIMIIRNVIYWN